VNIVLSLFTPTTAFLMDNDKRFKEYVAEVSSQEEGMNQAMLNTATACWRWLADGKELNKPDRPQHMIQLFARTEATDIDELLQCALGEDTHLAFVKRSRWDAMYGDYCNQLKALVNLRYTTVLCENEAAQKVNMGLARKIEWVTMDHPQRHESSYPLLTKSVLPIAADTLKRVQNAIAEVSSKPSLIVCLALSFDALKFTGKQVARSSLRASDGYDKGC